MVQAILQMGHTLGLQTIGEGVETPAQAEALERLDCDLVQGFLYSRPVPLDTRRTLLAGPSLDRRAPRGRRAPAPRGPTPSYPRGG